MLKSVPYSFAMAHAKDGVKQAAAYETERVETILKKLITAKGNIEAVSYTHLDVYKRQASYICPK